MSITGIGYGSNQNNINDFAKSHNQKIADETMDEVLKKQKEKNTQKALESGEKQEKNNQNISKAESDIVVKADGSRVLVTTVQIGGMKSSMSVEISKPTESINQITEENESREVQQALSEESINLNNI